MGSAKAISLIFFFGVVAVAYGGITGQRQVFINQKLTQTTIQPVVTCAPSTPCGWAIYDKFDRNIRSYIQNVSCNCDAPKLCYRHEDDLSQNTYIYRCREKDPRETGDYIS